ncbi:MAG: c-type cytochrome [Alcaligenaceae bacterium]|nr:c-type cytochrome [Alcaligenaceae bacterium]
MRTLHKSLIAAAVILAVAYGGASIIPQTRIPDNIANIDINDNELIQRGAYIARTADCVACHTVPNGKEYAGGLAMQTPVGAIYSTNITPDKETGIGNYSLGQFIGAVKHGVRADGKALYPAMPYPSYAIMPDEDIEALYAYFMSSVEPVRQHNADSTIPPVLNWRWPMAWWQLVFAPERTFIPDPDASAAINRGAYLVEGPGHCSACHTPRGIAYQELALRLGDGDEFLSGALIDGWRAKSLRGEARGLASWTQAELEEFLTTGRTDKVAAFGAMADVVQHSTQYFTPEDISSMAQYLKQLPPVKGRATELATKSDSTTQDLLNGNYTSRGATLYTEHCTTCHRADGQGVARIFPALDANSAIFANNAQSVIQITLEGGKMPATPADRMAFTMPAFNHLSDADIAEVINFIRNSWTNQAPPVNAGDVAKIRHFISAKAPHITPAGGHHE